MASDDFISPLPSFPTSRARNTGDKPTNVKGLKRWFRGLNIRQKIGYGYAVTISIAVLGAIVGRCIESYYEKQAMMQLNKAQSITHLLNQLQTNIIQVKSYEQKIFFLGQEKKKFQQDNNQILQEIIETNSLLKETNYLLKDYTANVDNPYHSSNSKKLSKLILSYQNTVKVYLENMQGIVRQLEARRGGKESLQAQKMMLDFNQSQVAVKVNELSDQLSILLDSFHKETQAELQDYREAEILGTLILLVSLFVSAVTAAVLAIYTSREVALPLETATQVAQRVSQEANFDLRVPVTTEDEVGVLTNSLNQLIEWVATYTKELKQAQAQLIQSEKMSSLGSMVAGIAHEINNPVNFIYGNLSPTKTYMEDLLSLLRLYQEHYPEPLPAIQAEIDNIDLDFLREDLPKTLSSIKNGADRIRELVLSLRNFSRLDEAELKSVNLSEGIDSTLVILNNRIVSQIEVKKEYGKLPKIECYPADINQVFMNIISNAIDALLPQDAPRVITIRTQVQGEEDKGNSNQEVKAFKNERVRITIADNGPGIDAEIQDKIFDFFFTTKPVGQGTGLGLSICYQIVQKHQGTITVNSLRGEGTEFIIELPIKQTISP